MEEDLEWVLLSLFGPMLKIEKPTVLSISFTNQSKIMLSAQTPSLVHIYPLQV